MLTASVGKIPEEVRPAVQSLLVALALLSIFIIGLVLEIIGSIFMLNEANIFRRSKSFSENMGCRRVAVGPRPRQSFSDKKVRSVSRHLR
jgi:hypothetical protein